VSDLNVFWWRWRHPVETNFGDEISVPILERLTGRGIRWAPYADAELIAAGSVLTDIRDLDADRTSFPEFWGTGFLWPYPDPIPAGVRPRAVRGRLTAAHFPEELRETMALGDPGILSDMLLDSPVGKRYRIGVVPHYRDVAHPAVRDLVSRPGVRFIDITWNPEEVVREIASCEVVLSSSLHGLIVSDAVGTPNAHLRMLESVGGPIQGPVHGLFKYRDYYSAYPGDRPYDPWYPADVIGVPTDVIVRRIQDGFAPPTGIEQMRRDLIAALPF
jgi:pyruvyltransferase